MRNRPNFVEEGDSGGTPVAHPLDHVAGASDLRSYVVQTKVTPPIGRTNDIPRTRLLSSLAGSPLRQLTLVCAPAGFGKSTLLGQWFESSVHAGLRAGWLSLDRRDNDAKRFTYHVIAAFQQIYPGAGAGALPHLASTVNPDITLVLTPLLNDIAQLHMPARLFMDDYHLVRSSTVHEFVELFLHLAPQNLSFVIASRMRPQLPLAAMRAGGGVLEFGAQELRFDSDEAEEFAHARGFTEADRDPLAPMATLVEGWPAALELALLSRRASGQSKSLATCAEDDVLGLAEYLAVEVLGQQSQEIRRFLLRTSPLTRLCAGACAAVTGLPDCSRLLARLEAEGMFLFPMDRIRSWYRFHHLFREFLIRELRQSDPSAFVQIYGDAADWFAAQGLHDEATEYALLSGDLAKVMKIVEPRALAALRDGSMPLAYAWIRRVPERALLEHPRLLGILGVSLFHMNRLEEARNVNERLMQLLSVASEDPELHHYARAVKAGIAIEEDDIQRVADELAHTPRVADQFLGGVMHNMAGYALAELGEFDSAESRLGQAHEAHAAAGSAFGLSYFHCYRALMDLERGDLDAACARFTLPNPNASGSDTYATAVADVIHGIIAHLQGQLAQAEKLLGRALPLLLEVGQTSLIVRACTALAQLHLTNGSIEAAERFLGDALRLCSRGDVRRSHAAYLFACESVKLQLRAARPTAALRIAARLNLDVRQEPLVPPTWHRIGCSRALIVARLKISQGELEAALSMLEQLASVAHRSQHRLFELECQLAALKATGSIRSPKSRLLASRVWPLLQHSGAIQLALDEGKDVCQALEAALLQDENFPMHADLLRRRQELMSRMQGRHPNATPRLPEPLSARELEVLGLLGRGYGGAAVGNALGISENTVKFHLKNLYAKLGARNRAAVIMAAQRLGYLLP